MSAAVAWVVVVPLAGAVATLAGGRRASPAIGAATAAASLALSAWIAWSVLAEGPIETAVGGWAAPLGIVLRADGLAAVMLLLTAVVGAAVSASAAGELGRAGDAGRWTRRDAFWPLWLMLWAGLAALFLSRDVFNVYVALELVTLCAVGLVLLGEGRAALAGGLRYLLAAWLGATAYLFGVALVYADLGTLDMVELSTRPGDGAAGRAALALMTVGLLMKAALAPLHFWLPRAHASAPSPVSAALSALVVTAAFTVVARIWSEALAGGVTVAAGTLVGLAGVVAIGWGSVLAATQRSLKLLVAYSTVGQVGYLFLLVPLAAVPLAQDGAPSRATVEGWTGGAYYALSHGLAKAAMFLAAGCMVLAAGSGRISAMTGMAGRLPVPAFAFAIAGVTLIGLPPTGGFVAKWYLVSSALRGDQPWWAAAVLAGSLLTAAYVLVVVRAMFAQDRDGMATRHAPVPRSMQLAAMALALACVATGLWATEGIELLQTGIPAPASDEAAP